MAGRARVLSRPRGRGARKRVIDMAASSFLNFVHFVNRSAGPRVIAAVSLLSACALVTLPGCSPRSPQGRVVEDSETAGRITVMTVPETRGLLDAEVAAFRKRYPDAVFEVRTATSREAVLALLEKRADVVALTRELETEERSVKVKGGMELMSYRFGRDAICVIVHPSNVLEHIAADDLRRIYAGALTDWSALGSRSGRIECVVPEPGSDAMTAFVQRVMGGVSPTAPAWRGASDSAIVAHVRATPGAIGFVGLPWAGRGAKVLDVAALTGLRYWNPDAERVYDGDYPLTRSCNLVARSEGAPLAGGLVTFISSYDGQKLVHEAGFVPTAVPVRFARRSPMLGTH